MMDYLALWNLWRYFASVTLFGNYDGGYLTKLPVELQDCALTLGKWIAELLF